MNNPTTTIEELKATLDAWIPKYIRQVVELRSGNKLTAERYNELMNLLITQGDDTIELAQVVKQYVELLVNELSNSFVETTENVTAIAEGAVDTAEGAVEDVIAYKESMDARLEEALKEVEDSLTAAEDVINSAAEIYDKVDEINTATESIKDGTTQVGNAKTLDGHEVEYFLPKNNIAISEPPTQTESCIVGLANSFTIGNVIFPIYAKGLLLTNGASDASLIVIDAEAQVKVAFRNNGTWAYAFELANLADLANYLPITGGRLTRYDTAILELASTYRNTSLISFFGVDGHLGYLGLDGFNNPCFTENAGVPHTLLHTGNKPSGTYTGNGDATARQISIGGIGISLILYGNGYSLTVTPNGAYGTRYTGEVKNFTEAELNFQYGVLNIKTNDIAVNEAGANYWYSL